MRELTKVKGILFDTGVIHNVTGARLVKIDPRFLVSDPTYQRPLSERHIEHILSRFWDKAFGTPDVNIRDGKLYAPNGQHTGKVAIKKGHKSIDAWVHNLSGRQEEARMFGIKNNSRDNKPMGFAQRFVSSVTGNDEISVAIQKICEEEGFTTPASDGCRFGRNADFSRCISILEWAYKYKFGSPEMLRKFLNVMKMFRIEDRLDRLADSKNFLRGLYFFMLNNSDMSACKIRVMIKKSGKSAGAIHSEARKLSPNGEVGEKHYKEFFQSLLKL